MCQSSCGFSRLGLTHFFLLTAKLYYRETVCFPKARAPLSALGY